MYKHELTSMVKIAIDKATDYGTKSVKFGDTILCMCLQKMRGLSDARFRPKVLACTMGFSVRAMVAFHHMRYSVDLWPMDKDGFNWDCHVERW